MVVTPTTTTTTPAPTTTTTSTTGQLVTVTETSTQTVTQTEVAELVCAKLVNVTGSCQVRRGKWKVGDEPIVMTFDDGLDFVDQLIQPTATLR